MRFQADCGTTPSPQTCPFLLRVFVRSGSHNEIQAYSSPSQQSLAKLEHSLYVWKDVTLRELVTLLRSVAPNLRIPGNAKFSVRHIYSTSPSSSSGARDSRPVYDYKDLGFVFARDLAGKGDDSGRSSRNDPSLRTLEQHKFIPGDFLDIAYLTHSGPNAASSSTSTSFGPAGNGPLTAGLPGSRPQSNLLGSSRRFGELSEADQAWGIAGDQTHHRRGGPGARSGGNRVNPLLNGRTAGGMSIVGAGAGRRASRGGEDGNEAPNGRTRRPGDDFDNDTRMEH